MIRINLIRSAGNSGGFCRLTVEGHAEAAPKGLDIVCAGVSSIVQMLAEWVEEDPSKQLCQKRVELEEGRAMIEVSARVQEMTRVLDWFGLAGEGLEMIAASYPQYVQYSDSVERKDEDDEDLEEETV